MGMWGLVRRELVPVEVQVQQYHKEMLLIGAAMWGSKWNGKTIQVRCNQP